MDINASFNTFIRNAIVTPITNYLNTRPMTNGQYSIDELMSALKISPQVGSGNVAGLPQPGQASSSNFPMGYPNIYQPVTKLDTGFVNNTKAGRQPNEAIPDHLSCKYRFQRGKNMGQFCGAKVVPGSEYCTACMKKSGVKKSGYDAQTFQPGMVGGFAGLPQTFPNQLMTAPQTQKSIKIIQLANGQCYHPEYKLILIPERDNPKNLICIGTKQHADAVIEKLTNADIENCKSLGIAYVTESGSYSQPGMPQLQPGMPQLGMPQSGTSQFPTQNYTPQSAMPQLPTANMPQLPTANMPQLPTANTPQLPTANMPQLPTANTPQLPTANMPQLPTANMPQLPTQNYTPQLPTQNYTPQLPTQNYTPQLPTQNYTPQLPTFNQSNTLQLPNQNYAPQLPTFNQNNTSGTNFPVTTSDKQSPSNVAESFPSINEETNPSDPVDEEDDDDDDENENA